MKAKWISPPIIHGQASLYAFKKYFSVNDDVKSFVVRISADTRYRLYINGRELSNGPCKSTKFVKYYEELDCKDALKTGENEIKILVLYCSQDEGKRFTTACPQDRAALYFDGTLVTENGEEKIVSDESFSASLAKHITPTWRPGNMGTIGPFEDVAEKECWEDVDVKVLYIPCTENNHYDGWGVKEKYMLEKRPVQILDIKEKTPLEAVREYVDENGKYIIILDPKRYTSDMVRYEYKAKRGTEIRIIYCETPYSKADDGTYYKDMRDNIDGEFIYGSWEIGDHYDSVIASGDEQVHDVFFYRSYRFVKLECSEKPEYFKLYAARYTYDFSKDAIGGGVGSFECSDNERYKKLWDISKNTLECCTHETFTDCPFYEDQQYIGDARFESVYAWGLSNDSLMQKKAILDTIGSIQTDGMIASTSPNMWVQVLHISLFYLINHMRSYLRFTGDVEFIKSLVGVLSFHISYFEKWKTPEGLINPQDGCRFIDWVDEWNRGTPVNGEKAPLTVYNLMYAASLKDAAQICDACGYEGLASDYRKLYKNLVEATNKYCFDKEKGLYVDVVGYRNFSQHTGMWAIISDAVTGEDAKKLARTMMTADGVAKGSFSKIYDLLRALDKVGMYDEYAPKLLSQWDDMIAKHCTTWCESNSYPRSECHGWSCIPLYEMTAMILGVTPKENGYEKIKIQPHLMGLTYAKGRVPTGYGYVDISWKKDGEKFTLDISSSKEVEMEIVLPGGKTETVVKKEYSVSE